MMDRQLDKNDVVVQDGTGNVFADLGLASSEEDKLKIKIAHLITSTVRKKSLTQAEAGRIMGIDLAKVFVLLRGRLAGISIERLFGFLVSLGRDVKIRVSQEHSTRQGRIRLKSAAA
jgi:predicted XRE-type DNA-binding protein